MNRLLILVTALVLVAACSSKKETLFHIRKGPELGITFQNTITSNDTLNALTFEYIYNGSGIGIGDFNNDGLEDIFFGGNQVSSELYLNTGKLKFQNITNDAGVSTSRWVTGVSVVDINRDGLMDLYLCVAGKTSASNRENILFINQGVVNGIPKFQEAASSFGLNDNHYSTMAAFFDYDKDGDQDMYLVNNWLEKFNRNNLRPKRAHGEAESNDCLYRNNGDNTFTNVSAAAGIQMEGYGLGVNICDINQDSWPDVYVANDFMSNDLLWINNGNGTFTNSIADYTRHQTHNGMGVDIADFNNDALADIMVVDMLPPGHTRQKMMTAGQNYDHFHMSMKLDYQPQYMRNTLQLNRGKTPDGQWLFSEIAFMAGVAQTDWSWAPLFADFDNDGFKDLFIANGYRKDVTNLDFIFFGVKNESPFGTPEARRKITDKEFKKIPDVKLSNYVFRNTGTLTFEDKTQDWGADMPTFSNGAAYADFDRDGDLDLITNNIDQEVIIYENTVSGKQGHYIDLINDDTSAFNQKIWLYTDGKVQYQESTPYRGFQSSVTQCIHFGTGSQKKVDSIRIVWSDQTQYSIVNINADTVLHFTHRHGHASVAKITSSEKPTMLTAANAATYTHHETSPSDIKQTRTLLHELTRRGPCLAKGDVNNDGFVDFYVGGETGTAGKLFVQFRDGTFGDSAIGGDSTLEDGDAVFLDADGDGDQDLFVGAACHSSQEIPGVHRLYLNNGKGKFSLSADALPPIVASTSCAVPADYDNDGDIDLFIGGYFKANSYPLPSRSYVLQNNHGKFTDVTKALNPELETPGLITSAVWTDINNDKRPDLVMAGEWMPIRIFINEGVYFSEQTETYGLRQSNGWWNCIGAADLNHDGFTDLVVGNTGRNSFFKPTQDHPVTLIAKDFDMNGSIDPLVTYYNDAQQERYIVHNRLVLLDQIPVLKKRFETFSQYASSSASVVLGKKEMEGALQLHVYDLSSAVFMNKAGRGFTSLLLPEIAQVSTINDLVIDDINEDGHPDIIAIGNNYAQETLFGRYDAGAGIVLLGDGKLHWKALTPEESRLVADGDARSIEVIEGLTARFYIVTNNNDKLQIFKHTNPQNPLAFSKQP
jgi:hypothetical protein